MRILHLLTSLGVGGAEKLVLALADRMSKRGHTVAILVLRPRLAEQLTTSHTVIHLDMRKSPLSVVGAVARGHRFLREFKPEIVHSHGFHGNIVARVFHLLRASPKPVSTIHNVYEGGRLRMLAYRLTDPLSRLTTAVSAAAAGRFIKLRAVPARKCIVLANGIDITQFTSDPGRRARTRASMNAGDDFVWLAAGRIVPAKDYPNLLRAFAHVRAEIPGTMLCIAGESADAAEYGRLRQLAEELGIEKRTKFLGLRRDLPALFDATDGFVLASAWEGMPLAVAEAMAMEKPVVATDVGGTRELVADCGTLVPPHDPHTLAEAILGLMRTRPDVRLSLGHAARARIAAHFTIDAKATAWESLYIRSLDPAK